MAIVKLISNFYLVIVFFSTLLSGLQNLNTVFSNVFCNTLILLSTIERRVIPLPVLFSVSLTYFQQKSKRIYKEYQILWKKFAKKCL